MPKVRKRPVDVLEVGQVWSDPALGDKLVRVHKLDRAGGRCQLRMANDPGPGKRWSVNSVLKRGMTVKIRRIVNGSAVAIEGDVTSSMNSGVTIANLRFVTYQNDKADS